MHAGVKSANVVCPHNGRNDLCIFAIFSKKRFCGHSTFVLQTIDMLSLCYEDKRLWSQCQVRGSIFQMNAFILFIIDSLCQLSCCELVMKQYSHLGLYVAQVLAPTSRPSHSSRWLFSTPSPQNDHRQPTIKIKIAVTGQ